MSTTERIATNIRIIARARNVKLKELSDRLGFKHEQQLYSRLRTGRFTAVELAEAADILRVEPGDLYKADLVAGVSDLSSYLTGRPAHTRGRAA